MQVKLRRRNEATNTATNIGTQQQRREIPRSDPLEKDKTQTSLPAEFEDPRKWIQNQLQKKNKRSSVHKRAKTRLERAERGIQAQTL